MSITNAFRIALRKASELVYDPTASGLTATDVQAAIDEVLGAIPPPAPPPPDPGIKLLSVQTVSSAVATVDFTSGIDATYDEYEITFDGVVPQIDDSVFAARVRRSGETTFESTTYLSLVHFVNTAAGGTATLTVGLLMSNTVSTGRVSNIASRGGVAGSLRFRPNGTAARKPFNGEGAYHSSGTGYYTVRFSGVWDGGNQPLDGVRFYFGAGNIVAGRFRLWGRRKDV